MRRASRALSAACGVVLLVAVPGRPARASLDSGWAGLSSVAAVASVPACPPAGYGVHFYAPGSGKTVALTFDDGPGRDTARIMNILEGSHVEATFFNLGMYEAQRARTVRSEQHAGFALGDHTWDHRDLTRLDAAGQAREIDRERREQAGITGAYPCLVRPPYGNYNATTLRLAQSRGMRVWCWSVDSEDWKAGGSGNAYWVNRIVSRADAGGRMSHPVILMHNQVGGNPATVAALPRIIRFYKSHGYRFVDLYGRVGSPVVRRVSPASGGSGGGTRVTITGHGFVGVPAVRFGSVAGRSVSVKSSTELSVTAPAQALGAVYVRVVTTFGTSPVNSATVFRYVAS